MTYIAFLRAINVAGHTIVKMQDLKAKFVEAGCGNVRTFIQSGNVVFDCPAEQAGTLCTKVSNTVRDLCGASGSVMFRALEDVERIVDAKPFGPLTAERALKLYVAFLAGRPVLRPHLPIVSAKEELEAIAITDSEAFIISRRKPNGFYGFPNNFIEKELGVAATSRNWSTVTKLVRMARCS